MAARKWLGWLTAGVVAASGLTTTLLRAGGETVGQHGKRASGCCVRDYGYDTSAGAVTASIVAIAPVDQPQNVETGAAPGQPRNPAENLRKAFFVDKPSIEADHVNLRRMALALYSDGRFVGTGLLSFDGGPDGALEGANVLIRVRAYAGVPQHPGGLEQMRLLWASKQQVWIGRNQAKALSLFPEVEPTPPVAMPGYGVMVRRSDPHDPSPTIRGHFHEITHLEVVLEHLRDR